MAFEPAARRLIDDAARAVRAAQRAGLGETGTLRVGFTGSAAFNPVVADTFRRFRRAFPDAELTLIEANTLQLMDGLKSDGMDAIFIRPGSARMPGMLLHHFPDEAMRIAVPSDHRLAKNSRATVADLANELFVLYPRAVGISLYESVFNACVNAGFTPRLAQEAPQISSVVNLVAAGLGVSIVPAAIAKVKVDGVRYLRIDGPAPVATLALASREGNEDPMLHHFLRLLSPVSAPHPEV
jgi:DNA-binding transcriptional LysR family regulator